MVSIEFSIKMCEARTAAKEAVTEEDKEAALNLLEVVNANLVKHENFMNSKELLETVAAIGLSYKDLGKWEDALFYLSRLCTLNTRYCPTSTVAGRDFYEYSNVCINLALDMTKRAHTIIKNSGQYHSFVERLEKQIECLEEFKVLK